MIEIRKLTLQDAAQYHEVRMQALQEFPTAFGSSFEEEQHLTVEDVEKTWQTRNPDNNFIVGAFSEGQLIGMVGFVQQTRRKTGHKGVLWGMYVKPNSQQGGLGTQLVTYLLEQVRDLPLLEQIQLAVVCDNVKAKRLYEKLGFQTYGTEKRALQVDGTFYDEDLMALFIK
ncbi:MAG: GNAT family N-acetyltransferase [Tumebacillaceae bacterium]